MNKENNSYGRDFASKKKRQKRYGHDQMLYFVIVGKTGYVSLF